MRACGAGIFILNDSVIQGSVGKPLKGKTEGNLLGKLIFPPSTSVMLFSDIGGIYM